MQLDKARLPSGATVAHLAYYLAEHLGCDPIIFVGQDLGFSRRAVLRARHQLRRRLAAGAVAVLHGRDEAVGADRPRAVHPPADPRLPGPADVHRGAAVHATCSSSSGTSARRKRDDHRRHRGRRGQARRDADAAAEAIRGSSAREPLPSATSPDGTPGQHWMRAGRCVASLQAPAARRRGRSSRSARTRCRCWRRSAITLDDQARVNRAIARIDALRARMNEFGATYDLVTQLTQRTRARAVPAGSADPGEAS